MRFQTVQVINYKSFRDSGEITLSPGFNVIVGKNDAGKSALVEALSLQPLNKPHRSLMTAPQASSLTNLPSNVKFTIHIEKEEFNQIFAIYKEIYWVVDNFDSMFAKFQEGSVRPVRFIAEWLAGQFSKGYLEFQGDYVTSGQLMKISNSTYPYEFTPVLEGVGQSYSDNSVPQIISNAFARRIYTFRAERMNVGECRAQGNSVLATNAGNLAEVLNDLIARNSSRFKKFLGHVKTVFPHVTHITAPLVQGTNQARIMIWSVPDESERDDLAVPLAESGTGIGQVLAILYVVVTADISKVIIIDEPQSFLHPGAVRKLLEILRSYPQHQYIITTHAPTAITATGAESLIQVCRNGQESIVDSISAQSESDLRMFLADIGASLSDVFGADQVLWVEGKTEELCFPMVIRALSQTPLCGLQILAVQSTADLEGKLAERVFEVYNRLTSISTLLPPAIAFILDREGKSDSQRSKIDEKSKQKVRWLPRRMYENYLLSPEGIAFILNEDDRREGKGIDAEDVQSWITKNANDRRYFDSEDLVLNHTDSNWEKTVHAASFLKKLFGELTDQRVSYDKVRHGLRLTKFIIANPTSAIIELSDFLKSVLADE
jgi:predicted ATPase